MLAIRALHATAEEALSQQLVQRSDGTQQCTRNETDTACSATADLHGLWHGGLKGLRGGGLLNGGCSLWGSRRAGGGGWRQGRASLRRDGLKHPFGVLGLVPVQDGRRQLAGSDPPSPDCLKETAQTGSISAARLGGGTASL